MQSFTVYVHLSVAGSNSSILPKLAVGAEGIAIAVRSVYMNRETRRPAPLLSFDMSIGEVTLFEENNHPKLRYSSDT